MRRVPFGLWDKVEKKLDELLDLDIIEEVPEGPSGWVSPLVVVPKSDGDVRVCVDMRRANEAIIRETHPIPTVEELLYDLNGSAVFSKIDLKWGFHQTLLSEESRHVTIFGTHRGLYRYKRLLFGVTSAPEKYQQVIKDVLRGCAGVANIADDIIIHGKDIEEHDRRPYAVLDRLSEVGLTVNSEKCEFRLTKLTFFGHDLTSNGVNPSEEKVADIRDARPPKDASEVRSFMGLVQYSAKFNRSQANSRIDKEGRCVYMGCGTANSLSRVKAPNYPGRDSCLLQGWMQDKNRGGRVPSGLRGSSHPAAGRDVESCFVCVKKFD